VSAHKTVERMFLEATNLKHYDKSVPTPLFTELREDEKAWDNPFSLQELDFFKDNL
jgi:hypothetical protein